MSRVRDIMSPGSITISADATLRDAAGLLDRAHIGGVPVVQGRQIVGVLSASDILEFQATRPGVPVAREEQQDWEMEPPTEWDEGNEAPGAYFAELWSDAGADAAVRVGEANTPEWHMLDQHTVAEAMTRTVCSIGPDAPVSQAARYMLQSSIHRLLVVERGALIGIVTTTDIVRGARPPARRSLPGRVSAKTVLASPASDSRSPLRRPPKHR